jgi:hypothetical protein
VPTHLLNLYVHPPTHLLNLLNLYVHPPTHLLNLYVSFSAMSLSPMSKVGYMDREGMKRGSAMNL